MGCLYTIKFPNGKLYVGITTGTAIDRFNSHIYEAERYGYRKLLGNALNKYGVESAVVTEVRHSDDWSELCQWEKNAIRDLNTKTPHGYNMTDGGDGSKGLKWTEEQKANSSRLEKLKGNKNAEGCVHTEDGKRRMVEALLGNTHVRGKTWKVAPEKRKNYVREKSIYERGKIAAGKSLAGALRNGRPVSLLPPW